MGRDLSCPFGKNAYKTKRDAQLAYPGSLVERCKHCRWWHPAKPRGKGRGKRGRTNT